MNAATVDPDRLLLSAGTSLRSRGVTGWDADRRSLRTGL